MGKTGEEETKGDRTFVAICLSAAEALERDDDLTVIFDEKRESRLVYCGTKDSDVQVKTK